jgi:phosphoadenosine phosphosulfate reductase
MSIPSLSLPELSLPELAPAPDEPSSQLPGHLDDPVEVLAWAADRYAGRIALVSALGPQSVAILRLLERIGRLDAVAVVLIDTGLLFPETLALAEAVEARFGVRIERVRPLASVAEQATAHGEALWSRDPDRCCALRKVEPLGRALAGRDAWITGLRASQGPSRAATATVAYDAATRRVKVAPLAHWSRADLVAFLEREELPINPLLERGYASVGCAPCTRRTVSFTAHPALGIDERAGRWAEHPGKTECGLHAPSAVASVPVSAPQGVQR